MQKRATRRNSRREVACQTTLKSDKIRTSTIEWPDPYGNLYFIRSHDFCTPVNARTRYHTIAKNRLARLRLHVITSTLARFAHYSQPIPRTCHLSNDTASTVYTEPPVTHFAILLKARRQRWTQDNDNRPGYRGYRMNVFPRIAVRNRERFDKRMTSPISWHFYVGVASFRNWNKIFSNSPDIPVIRNFSLFNRVILFFDIGNF